MTTQPELFQTPAPLLPEGARLRTVATTEGLISFTLLRSRRRSIGFVIGTDGLRVTAPYWVSLKQIDQAVQEKAAWIQRKLQIWRDRAEKAADAQAAWRACTRLPYLGTTISVDIDNLARKPRFDGDALQPQAQDTLWLPMSAAAGPQEKRAAAVRWLRAQAQEYIDTRIRVLADNAGLQFQAWKLSRARARWGSCNSAGHIRLNWRLVHFSHDVIDYVIAHELAHLRQLNHSAKFWAQVGVILPGYEAAMQTLKTTDMSALPELED